MRCEPSRLSLVDGALAIVAAVAFGAVLLGCAGGGATCLRHSDCPTDMVCGADSICAFPPDAALDASPVPADAGDPSSDAASATDQARGRERAGGAACARIGTPVDGGDAPPAPDGGAP